MIDKIIPTPKKAEISEETVSVPLCISTDVPEWSDFVDTFCTAVEKIFDVTPAKADGGIKLVKDETLAPASYVFDSKNGIVLKASADEGIVYAIATALQSVTANENYFTCPEATIEDCPDKDFRCIMIDLAREWHPARTIFKYIDVCFMLKIKYLHLHFIDDQRYTLPSKAFPLISSKQHYTFEDIERLNAYAKTHGVIIIPEFEAPGHAGSLNKSYPEVFANNIDNAADVSITTEEGLTIKADKIICAGRPETMDGVKTLLSEICEMFPDTPYIHIGGDEANIKAWKYCPDCLKYMEENGIEDEYELYSDFIGRVSQMVLDMGRTPIVWEGFPKKCTERVPKDTIVIAWESHYHLVTDLLEEGFRVINATWQPLYIVNSLTQRWGPKDIMNWNVYNWQHWWPNSYARLNPINVQPTDKVLGAQICSWNTTFEQDINMVMENTMALSERLWTVERLWDDNGFKPRYKSLVQPLARLIQDK